MKAPNSVVRASGVALLLASLCAACRDHAPGDAHGTDPDVAMDVVTDTPFDAQPSARPDGETAETGSDAAVDASEVGEGTDDRPYDVCTRPNGDLVFCSWGASCVDCPEMERDGYTIEPSGQECFPYLAYEGPPWWSEASRQAVENWNENGRTPQFEIVPTQMPPVECELARGCPTPLRAMATGTWRPRYPIALDHALLAHPGVGPIALHAPDGELLHEWVRTRSAELQPIPGSRDLLVASHMSPDPAPEGSSFRRPCELLNFLTRFDENLEAIWTLPLPNSAVPMMFPDHNVAAVLLNPWRCRYEYVDTVCPYFVAWISLDDGSVQSCGELPYMQGVVGTVESEHPANLVVLPHDNRAVIQGREELVFIDANDRSARITDLPIWREFIDEYDLPPVPLPDDRLLIRSGGGFHILDRDGNIVWEDFFVTPRHPEDEGPYRGGMFETKTGYVMGYDGTLYMGLLPRGVMAYRGDYFEGEAFAEVVDGYYGNAVAVLQDGTILFRDTEWIVAFEPGTLREMWRIESGGSGPFVYDDGRIVFLDEDQNLVWYQLEHGGLANTPLPHAGYYMEPRRFAPANPILGEPERERTWRWPEEVAEGSGDAP